MDDAGHDLVLNAGRVELSATWSAGSDAVGGTRFSLNRSGARAIANRSK